MKVRLGDICDIRDGTHDSPKYVTKGYPLVTSKNIINGTLDLKVVNFISEKDYNKINERSKVDLGDIIMPMIGTIGNPYLVNQTPNYAIKNVALIKFVNDKILNKYVLYYLKSNSFKRAVDEMHRGGTQKFISLGNIRDLMIEIVSKDKQQIIVNKLNKIFKVIEYKNRQLMLLDNLIKSRFVELFGDKGENPNGYSEDTLGNLYKFQYGKGNNIPEDKGEYPCYGSNGIVGHHTEFNSEDAPIIGHIGAYAGIVNWGEGKHYVTYNGVICKLRTDRINPIYGFYLLQQQDFNRVATKGGGQPFVSYGDLESPTVVVPPIEIQNDYAAFAKQVDKLKFYKSPKWRERRW